VSLRSVQRIREAHQLAPHRIRTFKLSMDPEFVEKLRDIVGLYVDPPAQAVVLSVDEKSQIQALDRTQPGLPMKEGPSWDDDPRLLTPWHNDAVCRPQCARRHRHRPQHAAPPAPGGSSASSTPPRCRCRCEWRSTPSSTTKRPTNIPRYKNGWPGIPAGRFTSRLPRRPGSTPSKASSPNSRDGASSVECSGRLPTFRLQSTGSSKKPTPIPNPPSGPLTPNASSLLSNEGKKS